MINEDQHIDRFIEGMRSSREFMDHVAKDFVPNAGFVMVPDDEGGLLTCRIPTRASPIRSFQDVVRLSLRVQDEALELGAVVAGCVFETRCRFIRAGDSVADATTQDSLVVYVDRMKAPLTMWVAPITRSNGTVEVEDFRKLTIKPTDIAPMFLPLELYGIPADA